MKALWLLLLLIPALASALYDNQAAEQTRNVKAYTTAMAQLTVNPYTATPTRTPIPAGAPFNGQYVLPPMGFLSYYSYGDNITQAQMQEASDLLVSTGLTAAGYTWCNLDAGWSKGRDAQGNILPKDSFPDMKAMTDYIHANGQKTTMYTTAGAWSCSIIPQPGSAGHVAQDVQAFADWGFDGVKMDWCTADGSGLSNATLFSNAILATGKPMAFDLCEWSFQDPWTWGAPIANSWRTADQGTTWDSILLRFHQCAPYCAYTRPGFWGNPGEITIGYGSMTNWQWEAQFYMHCILAAPMILDTPLATLTAPQLAILKNAEAIAVNQDPAGNAGCLVHDYGDGREVYVKTQTGTGQYAAMLLNTVATGQTITLTYSDFGKSGSATVRNLGTHTDLGTFENSYSHYVTGTGAVLLKLEFIP